MSEGIDRRIHTIESGAKNDAAMLRNELGKHSTKIANATAAYQTARYQIPYASHSPRIHRPSSSEGVRRAGHITAVVSENSRPTSSNSALRTEQRAQSARSRRLANNASRSASELGLDRGMQMRSPEVEGLSSFAEARSACVRAVAFVDVVVASGTNILLDLKRATDYYYSDADNYSDAYMSDSEAAVDKIKHSPRSRALIYTGKSIPALVKDATHWIIGQGRPITDSLLGAPLLSQLTMALAEDTSTEAPKRLDWSSLENSNLPVTRSPTAKQAHDSMRELAQAVEALKEAGARWVGRWEQYEREVKSLSHPPNSPRGAATRESVAAVSMPWTLQTMAMLGVLAHTNTSPITMGSESLSTGELTVSKRMAPKSPVLKSKSAIASRLLAIRGNTAAKVFPTSYPLSPAVTNGVNQRPQLVRRIPQPPDLGRHMTAQDALHPTVDVQRVLQKTPKPEMDGGNPALCKESIIPLCDLLQPTMHGTIQAVLGHSARTRQSPDCFGVAVSIEGTERPVPISEWPQVESNHRIPEVPTSSIITNEPPQVLAKANSYSRLVAASASAKVTVNVTPSAMRLYQRQFQRATSDTKLNKVAQSKTEVVSVEGTRVASRPSSGAPNRGPIKPSSSRPSSASHSHSANNDQWSSSRRSFRTRDTTGDTRSVTPTNFFGVAPGIMQLDSLAPPEPPQQSRDAVLFDLPHTYSRPVSGRSRPTTPSSTRATVVRRVTETRKPVSGKVDIAQMVHTPTVAQHEPSTEAVTVAPGDTDTERAQRPPVGVGAAAVRSMLFGMLSDGD